MADDFLQPLGNSLDSRCRVTPFQRAGILDVLLTIGTFRREADVVSRYARCPFQPLEKIPHRAGVIEFGLLVPASRGGKVNGRAGILALLRRQPELALRMLGSMSSHLRVLVGQLEDLTLRDVETRLANWLIKRCPKPDGDRPVHIELTMTKRVLAAELGTVSETFSRTLAKFRDLKLLTVKAKSVTVISPAKLSALLRRNLGE